MTDGRQTAWSPAVDVVHDNGKLVIKADIPGISPDEVKIEVEGDVLRVSGSHEESTEDKRDDYLRRERRFGSFYRAVPLPAGVDASKIEARTHKGVLEIVVPLPAEANKQPTRITPPRRRGTEPGAGAALLPPGSPLEGGVMTTHTIDSFRIARSTSPTGGWPYAAAALGTDDRQDAYRAVRGVLHTLRDRLPVEESAQLAAQLPTLLRGVFYEGAGARSGCPRRTTMSTRSSTMSDPRACSRGRTEVTAPDGCAAARRPGDRVGRADRIGRAQAFGQGAPARTVPGRV